MRSAVWKHTLSSAARASSLGPVALVMPKRAPRTSASPIRRAETDEGRDKNDLLMRIGFGCQWAALIDGRENAERITHPLNGGTGDEDRPFERVNALAAELISDGRQQTVLRHDRLRAGVEQRETSSAVRRFHHAGLEAGLANHRGLLVPGTPRIGTVAPNTS